MYFIYMSYSIYLSFPTRTYRDNTPGPSPCYWRLVAPLARRRPHRSRRKRHTKRPSGAVRYTTHHRPHCQRILERRHGRFTVIRPLFVRYSSVIRPLFVLCTTSERGPHLSPGRYSAAPSQSRHQRPPLAPSRRQIPSTSSTLPTLSRVTA